MTTINDIITAANKLKQDAESPDLTKLNSWEAGAIKSFQTNYANYIAAQGTSPCLTPKPSANGYFIPIKDQLASLYALGTFMQNSFIPYFNLVQGNLNLLDNASKEWFTQSFNSNTLMVNLSTSVSMQTFAKNLVAFQSSPCKSLTIGDNSAWQVILLMYYFTPWTNENPIQQLFMNAPNYCTPA